MKTLSILSTICFALLLLISSQNTVQANTGFPIAHIIEIEGSATVKHNDQKTSASQNTPLYLHDVVETTENSKALLLFIDDTHITLAENTELFIEEFLYDPDHAKKNKGHFDFLKGAFLWTSGQIAAKDNPKVTLETAVGSIGIRGTTVWGGTLDNKYGVFVQDGLVTYKGEWGERDIAKNEGIFVSKDKILRDVKIWNPPMIDIAVNTITFSDSTTTNKALKSALEHNTQKREAYKTHLKNTK